VPFKNYLYCSSIWPAFLPTDCGKLFTPLTKSLASALAVPVILRLVPKCTQNNGQRTVRTKHQPLQGKLDSPLRTTAPIHATTAPLSIAPLPIVICLGYAMACGAVCGARSPLTMSATSFSFLTTLPPMSVSINL